MVLAGGHVPNAGGLIQGDGVKLSSQTSLSAVVKNHGHSRLPNGNALNSVTRNFQQRNVNNIASFL